MDRHILLAFATSKYDEDKHPKEFQRPILSEVLTSIVDLFTNKLKIYRRDLADIGENPNKTVLESRLEDWVASEERDSSDWVVLYYTGHATVIGNDSLYFITHNTVQGHISNTAFSFKKFADTLLEERPRKPGKMLIIIDTCSAGTGAIQLASELQRMLFKFSRPEIYLLSATMPDRDAEAGELASALTQSIEELSTRNVSQKFFSIEDVMEQINSRLRTQEAVFIPGMIMGRLQFFPNPSFEDTGGRAVLANEAQRAIRDQEFREHWGPRSRGVEFDTEAGDYFSGRTVALKEIRDYLSGTDAARPLVVTGKAGAGKSAILSRIVAQSRKKSSGIPALDVAIHAKGKTLEDVMGRIAAPSGGKLDTKGILERMAQSGKAIRVVVDALDEAAEPEAIADFLLRPMGATGKIHLLVGSRENCIPLLGDVDVIDVDLHQYSNDRDIAEYAKRRLLRKEEPDTPTLYAGKEEWAEAAAETIAKHADRNFLVARLLVEDLLLRKEPLDPATSAKMTLPATVAAAFDAYLSRFGARETMVRDLLLPLAYAEGKGFPWGNLWAQVASYPSKRSYHDDDIRWLLREAGAFILESSEDGQAVYRLYHLALQEAIRSKHDDPDVQIRLRNALIASVPRIPDDTGKDWLVANRYIRRHLGAHAAVTGLLDELLVEPMFLVAAIPGGLLPVLRLAESREPRRAARMYKMAAHHWDANASPGIWASYLEFTAQKLGLEFMARRFAALRIGRPWRTAWVSSAPSSAHRILRGHEGPVRAVAIQNDTLISSGDDGTIRSQDIDTGELKRDPFRGHEGAIQSLAAGTVRNRGIVVSGGDDSTVRVWSLQTGVEILPAMSGHRGAVYAVLLAELGEESLIISGGYDGTIRFWNAATGEPVRKPIRGHTEWIRALALCSLRGTPVLISTGDSGSIRVWDAINGMRLAEARSTNVVNALACFELSGKTVLASANHSGRIEIWDPATMTLVCAPIKAEYSSIFSLVASNLNGSPVLITGDVSGVIKIWNAETQQPAGRPIAEHDRAVLALASDSSRALIVSGGLDGTVRLWELEEAQRGPYSLSPPSFGQDSEVWSVAASGSIVIARSYDRRIRVFDLPTGEFVGEISSGAGGFEIGVALADSVNGPILGFDMSGEIFVRELAKLSTEIHLGSLLGGKAQALLFQTIAGANILTAVSGDGEVKSWDVIERKQIRNCLLDIHRGWQDLPEQWKDTLALGILAGGRAVVLSGGSGSGLLRIWNADTGELIGEIRVSRREQAWTTALAIGNSGDRQWIASGNSDGTLTLWDARDFKQIADLPGEASIYALAIASIAERPAVLWGGRDHLLHAWWPETNRRQSIDLGFPVNAITVAPDGLVITGTTRGIIATRFEL